MPLVHQFRMLLAEGGSIIFKVIYCSVAMLIINESAHSWSDCTWYYFTNCLDSISDLMETASVFHYQKPVSYNSLHLFFVGNNEPFK